jgi:hypothetical protein
VRLIYSAPSFLDQTFVDELLIDFQELIGAHTGENMAEVVWDTLDLYGLKGKVRHYNFNVPFITDTS